MNTIQIAGINLKFSIQRHKHSHKNDGIAIIPWMESEYLEKWFLSVDSAVSPKNYKKNLDCVIDGKSLTLIGCWPLIYKSGFDTEFSFDTIIPRIDLDPISN